MKSNTLAEYMKEFHITGVLKFGQIGKLQAGRPLVITERSFQLYETKKLLKYFLLIPTVTGSLYLLIVTLAILMTGLEIISLPLPQLVLPILLLYGFFIGIFILLVKDSTEWLLKKDKLDQLHLSLRDASKNTFQGYLDYSVLSDTFIEFYDGIALFRLDQWYQLKIHLPAGKNGVLTHSHASLCVSNKLADLEHIKQLLLAWLAL